MMRAPDLERLCRSGVHMVVGASDTGKSMLVRELAARLVATGRRVAIIDGDIGQSSFGLPATVTLALPEQAETVAQVFIGATSPPGHLLPLIVGLHRLLEVARGMADTVLVDTTGLVEGNLGVELKLQKIECLRPDSVIARMRNEELEPILTPLRRRAGLCLVELPAASEAVPRPTLARRQHRARKLAAYFRGAATHAIPRQRLCTWGSSPELAENRMKGLLLGLNDAHNLCLGLGLVVATDASEMQVLTPLRDLGRLRFVRFGSLWIDATSGEDRPRGAPG